MTQIANVGTKVGETLAQRQASYKSYFDMKLRSLSFLQVGKLCT